ncbi:MAG: glutaredoxin family protein [Proteobacteria bacterium]|nr:glutaredoxin family protein [Pseudomonadota bacterium]
MRLLLYGRGWCHLCEDMVVALRALQDELGFGFEILDVDDDPVLEARFGERVPVLVAADGGEICHYHLDEAALRERLAVK